MEQSRTKKGLLNMSVAFGCQIITILLSFVSRSVFIRLLSSEYLGINGLFSNILTVLSFAELGIGEALTFAMYRPAKEGDTEKLRQLLQFYQKAYTAIAGAVMVIGLGISFFLDYLVAETPTIHENFQLIFILFLINNASSYLMAYKQSVLFVDQKKYIVSYVNQVSKIAQLILQTITLIATGSYYLFLVIQIVCTLGNNIVITWYTRRQYTWTRTKSKQMLPREEKEEIFQKVKALSISKIAGVVSNGADNIIIAKILGLTSVGVVSNYTLIINAVNGVVWTSLSGITASLGNFNVDADIERRRNIFEELYQATYWICSFCCVCLLCLLKPFIEIWIGGQYAVDWEVQFALVFIMYVSGVNFPLYSFRITRGMFQQMKYPYLMFGVLNVILSILLGMKFGLFGVYIATSISRLITAEAADGYIVYKSILERPVWRYMVRYLLSALLFFANYLLTNAVVTHITLAGVVGFVAKVATCVVVSNIIFILCLWKTDGVKRLRSRFFKRR